MSQFILEKLHLPLFLDLLKVVCLLVLCIKSNDIILIIVKMRLPTSHHGWHLYPVPHPHLHLVLLLHQRLNLFL